MELDPSVLRSSTSSHWEPMLGNDTALEQKLRRSDYVLQQLNQPGRVLDYGSGLGFLSCHMARYAEVVGVEIVPEWRETSRRLAESWGVGASFVGTDDGLERESFDAAVMCNTISHIAGLTRVLIRIRDLLKPGAILFVEDNNNRQSVLVRLRQPKIWAEVEAACRDLRPGMEEAYGLGPEQLSTWRGKDLQGLKRLREFAPRHPIDDVYHENWFTVHEVELLLFHAGFAPVDSRAKYIFDFKTHRTASWFFRTFPRLSLWIAPAFEVTAVRV
jgi:SAM-dependent methyltransferase